MKLTKEQREEIIADLISNENNVYTANDRVGFEALGDERLAQFGEHQEQIDNAVLVANVASGVGELAFNEDSEEYEFHLNGEFPPKKKEAKHDDHDDEDDEDEEEEIVESCGSSCKKGKKMAKNELSEAEWMQNAPASIRRIVANAQSVENHQKEDLVDVIMSNQGNRLTENQLMQKDLDSLQDLAALCGNSQPTQPSYVGANIHNQRSLGGRGFSEEDVLHAPVMNFSNDD